VAVPEEIFTELPRSLLEQRVLLVQMTSHAANCAPRM
jgi:hypothetical protein